jgi:hypothetical protein
VGRTTVFPTAGYFFVSGIKNLSDMLVIGMFLIIIPVSAFIGIREIIGVAHVWDHSFSLLLDKINNPETKVDELSKVEILVVNVRMFGLYNWKSDRILAELEKNKALVNVKENKIELHKMFEINRLIGKSKSQGSAAVKGDQAKTEVNISMVQIMKKATAVIDTPNDDELGSTPNPLVEGKNRRNALAPVFKHSSAADFDDHFNSSVQFKKSISKFEDSDDES